MNNDQSRSGVKRRETKACVQGREEGVALGPILHEEAVEVEGARKRRKCSKSREEQSCAPNARENKRTSVRNVESLSTEWCTLACTSNRAVI